MKRAIVAVAACLSLAACSSPEATFVSPPGPLPASAPPIASPTAKARSKPTGRGVVRVDKLTITKLAVTGRLTADQVVGTVSVATTGTGTLDVMVTFVYPTGGITSGNVTERFQVRAGSATTRTFSMGRVAACAYRGTQNADVVVSAAVFSGGVAGPTTTAAVHCP